MVAQPATMSARASSHVRVYMRLLSMHADTACERRGRLPDPNRAERAGRDGYAPFVTTRYEIEGLADDDERERENREHEAVLRRRRLVIGQRVGDLGRHCSSATISDAAFIDVTGKRRRRSRR